MSGLLARWVDVAIDEYLALAPATQVAVDDAVRRLLTDPSGPASAYDPSSDQWTVTAGDGQVMIVYVFRPGGPWLVVLRLVVI